MSAYHNTLYDNPRSPPAVPYHGNQYDAPYASYSPHTSDPTLIHQPNPYPETTSATRFTDPYNSDDEGEKIVPRERKRRSCLDKLCCGCCTCCPRWMRWCTCILFLLILVLAIVIGVLVALFKMPTVEFTGLKGSPKMTNVNNMLNMTFDLGITVHNPNFESITFEKIWADAYYPSPYSVKVGGGEVSNVHIVSNGVTNITFPFAIHINSTDPAQQGVMMDLVTKCGLDGSTKRNIDLNYYVHPTVRIVGIAITPKIAASMSVPCPIQGDDLAGILGSFV
ncbi:hypothetical protein BY458DRAFT_518479 [Sporodiniella umbellata]|nr:hypothetical protein BY458DRAFT_518479 [Sporodiniella umbellata]